MFLIICIRGFIVIHNSILKENKNEIYTIISIENQALYYNTSVEISLCLTELKHVPKYSISDDTYQTLLQT